MDSYKQVIDVSKVGEGHKKIWKHFSSYLQLFKKKIIWRRKLWANVEVKTRLKSNMTACFLFQMEILLHRQELQEGLAERWVDCTALVIWTMGHHIEIQEEFSSTNSKGTFEGKKEQDLIKRALSQMLGMWMEIFCFEVGGQSELVLQAMVEETTK